MKISDFLKSVAVSADLQSSGKLDVLAELGSLLAASNANLDEKEVVAALVERERLATTGFGEGAAIPHAKSDSLDAVCGAVGVSRTGIQFDAVDGKPVHIFFALLAPQGSTSDHLKALARVSKHLREPSFSRRVLAAKTASELYDAIIEEDGKS